MEFERPKNPHPGCLVGGFFQPTSVGIVCDGCQFVVKDPSELAPRPSGYDGRKDRTWLRRDDSLQF